MLVVELSHFLFRHCGAVAVVAVALLKGGCSGKNDWLAALAIGCRKAAHLYGIEHLFCKHLAWRNPVMWWLSAHVTCVCAAACMNMRSQSLSARTFCWRARPLVWMGNKHMVQHSQSWIFQHIMLSCGPHTCGVLAL
jgi:hypothetical protein